jgi:hypothetical protein
MGQDSAIGLVMRGYMLTFITVAEASTLSEVRLTGKLLFGRNVDAGSYLIGEWSYSKLKIGM